ncbi:hypothetical protein EVJ58_g7698, partial [Rhodofomes roseus]
VEGVERFGDGVENSYDQGKQEEIARVHWQEAFTSLKAFTPEEAVSRILSIVAKTNPKDNASFWYYEWRKKD